MVFAFKKIAAGILLGSVLLASCGEKDNGNVIPDVVTPDVTPVPDTVEPLETTGQDFASNYHVMGLIKEPMSVYTVDMLIRSDVATEFTFTDTTPAMPFVLNIVNAVQLKKSYKFTIGSQKTPYIGGMPLEWTRFTFSSDGSAVKVYVNGDLVSTVEDSKALTGRVLLGKGYKNRGWSGTVSYFDIYGTANIPEDFTATSSRLTGDRLYSLDDLSPPK